MIFFIDEIYIFFDLKGGLVGIVNFLKLELVCGELIVIGVIIFEEY